MSSSENYSDHWCRPRERPTLSPSGSCVETGVLTTWPRLKHSVRRHRGSGNSTVENDPLRGPSYPTVGGPSVVLVRPTCYAPFSPYPLEPWSSDIRCTEGPFSVNSPRRSEGRPDLWAIVIEKERRSWIDLVLRPRRPYLSWGPCQGLNRSDSEASISLPLSTRIDSVSVAFT